MFYILCTTFYTAVFLLSVERIIFILLFFCLYCGIIFPFEVRTWEKKDVFKNTIPKRKNTIMFLYRFVNSFCIRLYCITPIRITTHDHTRNTEYTKMSFHFPANTRKIGENFKFVWINCLRISINEKIKKQRISLGGEGAEGFGLEYSH